MIQTKNVEKLDKSNVRLSVTLSKDASEKAYKDLLKEYAQKAQIKGFRPGKVPPAILETKFGESIRMEAAQNLVEESLKTLFAEIEEKPLPYAQPSLDGDINFVPGEEFSFKVTYDVYPTVSLTGYTGLTVEEAQVSIAKDDIEDELKRLQDQNAVVADTAGPVVDKDIVTATFFEIDDKDEEVFGTKRQDFVFTVGEKSNYYEFDKEVVGLAKDAETIITKKYPADHANTELAGKKIRIKLAISRIRRKDLPAIDDELAQDIDEKFKTLDDLKKDIKDRLGKTAESRVRQKKIGSLLDQIVAANPVIIPESMVNAELYNKYDQMLRQLGGNEQLLHQLLAAQGQSIQTLFDQWKPVAEKELAAQVIVRELIKLEKISATDDEVDAEIRTQSEASKMSFEETKDYYQKNNAMDYVKTSVEEKKLFETLLAKSTVKKGEKIKYVDLMKENS